MIKTRYTQVWAYDKDWNRIWTVEMPGVYRTAHQPIPIDIDGEGKDEVMAGYALINSDGSTRWKFESQKVYTEEKGKKPTTPVVLGTGVNFSLY